ncbi:MAG: HAD hydrolase family protein [Rhodospirillales bacterium]|nr:HAD hydrolase family protein [Rhodospirillales bacterium]
MSQKRTLPDPLTLIVFDFDGVFTDNKVYTAQDGSESVMCDRRDGLGVRMLKDEGIEMFILSMETNPVVEARARKLGLAVQQGCDDKAGFLAGYLQEHGIEPATVIYMGNDLNDLGAMKVSGYAVAPADAHPTVLEVADLVVAATGGNGAVRELCEFILKSRKTQ